MKGLLLKDWYLLSKYCRAFLVIIVVFSLAAPFGGSNMFMILYPAIMGSLLPVSLLSYDEREKWDSYALCLPYSRAQLVSAKYLMGLMISGVILVLIALGQGLRISKGLEVQDYGAILLTVALLSLVSPAIMLPFMFHFGTEKGRLFYYLGAGLICGGAVAMGTVGNAMPPLSTGLGAGAVVLAVLLYAGSWLLSVRLYKNRDL